MTAMSTMGSMRSGTRLVLLPNQPIEQTVNRLGICRQV
jgi:hypothetical protein